MLRLASTKSVGQSAVKLLATAVSGLFSTSLFWDVDFTKDADTLHAGLGLPSKLGGSGGVTKARICQKQPN